MLIDSLMKNTGTEAMDRLAQFTEARQQVLANDLANISTPDYKMQDLNLTQFQQDLKKAVDNRTLTSEKTSADEPAKTDYQQYALFHDGNNRSPEKLVSRMTQNTMMHNVAVEVLRNRFSLLERAVSLKP